MICYMTRAARVVIRDQLNYSPDPALNRQLARPFNGVESKKVSKHNK